MVFHIIPKVYPIIKQKPPLNLKLRYLNIPGEAHSEPQASRYGRGDGGRRSSRSQVDPGFRRLARGGIRNPSGESEKLRQLLRLQRGRFHSRTNFS